MEWRLISTFKEDDWPVLTVHLLWNGKHVFAGWLDDDGWHYDGNVEWQDNPEDPQPTHWAPLPDPPVLK